MDITDQQSERRLNKMPGCDDPTLQSLERYWQTLRNAQRLPARNDISPQQIDHVLPHAFILQRVAPGIARFRVAGQKMHDLLKMDARGMPLTTLFTPQARNQVQELVESAFSGPAIIGIPLVSPASLLRPQINATILLLPMRDHEDKPSRMLGALVTDEPAGNRPRRFDIQSNARIRNENLGIAATVTPLVPRRPAAIKRPDAKRPALTLVVNNG